MINSYDAYKEELQIPDLSNITLPLKPWEHLGFSGYFLTKMIYSCLVDADFLDTENHMQSEKSNRRGESITVP